MNVLKDIRGWYGWLVSLALVLWRQLSFGIVDGKFLTQTKWIAKQRPDNPQVLDPHPKRRLDRGMKPVLLSLVIALLMVGCGEQAQPSESVDMNDTAPKKDATETAVDWSKLQDREGVMYLPNEETPFTGRAERFYENGQKFYESNYKEGLKDGLHTWWRHEGEKKLEGNFKDGKEDGLWTRWYKSGQKREEKNYTNNKPMSVQVWKPNGQKCPVTNVKNGNGVVVRYFDDGTEWGRITYKDGEPVKD